MEAINTNQLLQQLQSLARQAGVADAAQPLTSHSAEFGHLLKQSIRQVNTQQHKAARLAEAFEREDPNVDLAQVMIEKQKARLAFEALMQVRNRLVTAYQDIMNMPV